MSYFRNYQKKNCNEVKAKWRTCPVGELAPVSPIVQYKPVTTQPTPCKSTVLLRTVESLIRLRSMHLNFSILPILIGRLYSYGVIGCLATERVLPFGIPMAGNSVRCLNFCRERSFRIGREVLLSGSAGSHLTIIELAVCVAVCAATDSCNG